MSDAGPLGKCHFRADGVPCNASVLWLKYELTGRPAPIDAEPDPAGNGNVRIDLEAGTYAIVSGEELEQAHEAGEPLHLNHWVTCPAAQSRKAR